MEAITSGRVVPSNYWRACEVIRAVASRGVPEAAELAEAYRAACRDGEHPATAPPAGSIPVRLREAGAQPP